MSVTRRSCSPIHREDGLTTKGTCNAFAPLAGKVFDRDCGRHQPLIAELTPFDTRARRSASLRDSRAPQSSYSGQKDLSGWRLPAPMLEQTVVHLIRQHVNATTFSASLIHTPTMQELASVRRFLDGLCSGSKNDSASVSPPAPSYPAGRHQPRLCVHPARPQYVRCFDLPWDQTAFARDRHSASYGPFRLLRRGSRMHQTRSW